jgi:5-methylcytosine-specific restriction endonuclease McrA
MSRSLVLNASYEPLSIVPARRAVVLVLEGKAELVHADSGAWRSERMALPAPSVVRLRYYVSVPYRRRCALSRRAVFLRDGGQCQYCGRRAENLDHVVPRSRGGAHSWENVVACCTRCNVAKRDRLVSETSLRLRRRPSAPSELSWVVVAVGRVPESWMPYVAPTDRPEADTELAGIA